jgi:hypothetical protein
MESITSEELQPKRSRHDSLQNANDKHAANPQPYAILPLTAAAPLTPTWYAHPPLQPPSVQIPTYSTASAPPLSARANFQPPLSTNITGYQCQIKPFYLSTRLKPQLEPVLPSLNLIHKKKENIQKNVPETYKEKQKIKTNPTTAKITTNNPSLSEKLQFPSQPRKKDSRKL